MKIFIKYMVTRRCKLIVQATLDQLGITYCVVDIGEVELKEAMTDEQRDQLNKNLLVAGLELIDDKKVVLIEKIKKLILELVQDSAEPHLPKLKNSDYISKKLDYDYTYLSNLFSQVTGTTIERFLIMQRIEKAKELLLYDELSSGQIAYKLHFSSVAHFSNQFKKMTGLTPSCFKRLKTYYQEAQQDDVLHFDQLCESMACSLSARQRHDYHRSLHRGCTVVITNFQKTILWASRSFLTMTGYNPLHVLGKTPHFLQGPGTDAVTLRFIRDKLNAAETVEADLVNYRSNGESYVCHLRIEPICNEQGEVTHFFAVEYDVEQGYTD